MRAILTSICGMVVLCCAAAFMWTAEAAMQDTDFFTQAAEGGLAEVALSNVALQKAQSEEVKQFAQQMVTEHTQANQELTQLASTKSVTIPTVLPDKRQRDVTKLNGLSGADFDREYMKMMVSDHEKTVKLFQRQAERGTDADAKAWAAKMLPALQGHLTMARTMYETTKTAARSGSDRGNSSDNNSSAANSSNSNSSTDVRQDTNGNDNGRYSNLRPNVNANANANTNSNTDTDRNTNSNRGNNTNSNTNSNRRNNSNTGNANNSNTGNMNHR